MVMVAEQDARTTTTTTTAAPPAHPGAQAFLGKTFAVTTTYSHKLEAVSNTSGTIACTYGGLAAPIYLLAGIEGTTTYAQPKNNTAVKQTATWVGWNNVLTNVVTRYLIVEDFAANGTVVSQQCTQYPDTNPPGYKDPISLMAARYQLNSSSAQGNMYSKSHMITPPPPLFFLEPKIVIRDVFSTQHLQWLGANHV